MICINLLPYREAQRLRNLRILFIAWSVTLVVGICLLLVVDSVFLDKIFSFKTQQDNNNKIIHNLDEKLGEIKDLNKRKELVLARLELITRLSLERTIPVHILDELTRTIPEHVWLTSFRSQANHLNLKGLAMSSAVVADFMRQLSGSPYFSDIELSLVLQKPDQKGGTIKSFSLDLVFSQPSKEE